MTEIISDRCSLWYYAVVFTTYVVLLVWCFNWRHFNRTFND